MLMELDKRNTLFPSEQKLLTKTVTSILHRYNGGIRVDEVKRAEWAELKRLLLHALHKEEDALKACTEILAHVTMQYNFLSTFVPDPLSHDVESFRFIADKLEPVMEKMQARCGEIHALQQGGYNVCIH